MSYWSVRALIYPSSARWINKRWCYHSCANIIAEVTVLYFSKNGNTALHTACLWKNARTCQLLIAVMKVEIDIPNKVMHYFICVCCICDTFSYFINTMTSKLVLTRRRHPYATTVSANAASNGVRSCYPIQGLPRHLQPLARIGGRPQLSGRGIHFSVFAFTFFALPRFGKSSSVSHILTCFRAGWRCWWFHRTERWDDG